MTELSKPSRRGLLLGLGALFAAPAIVRATSLMPIRAPKLLLPEFAPGAELVTRLDVLYGTLQLGDVITFEGVKRWWQIKQRPRQFVVTAIHEPSMEISPCLD